MTYNTKQVINDWTNNRDAFVNSSGNTSTSSLNLIINDFLQYFEKRVRAKIATPSSIRGDLVPKPNQIESLYKPEINKILLENTFLAVEQFGQRIYSYTGLSNGTGLEDYLIALENTDEFEK